MRFFRLLWMFTVLSISIGLNSGASSQLQLSVSETKVNKELFPGAKAYSGKLANTTTQTIRLEAVQILGEYAGGTFYPCEVQFWNGKTRQWRSFGATSKRSENSGGLFFNAEIKPNESLEVCHTLLVKEVIKGGKCARFALTFQWNHKPDILSRPFVIPDPAKADRRIECPQ